LLREKRLYIVEEEGLDIGVELASRAFCKVEYKGLLWGRTLWKVVAF